jgi:hypothetical protein
MGMNNALVRYVCRAKAHIAMSLSAKPADASPVTIHAGSWAYCPAGARADHSWEAVEPVTLANLKLLDAALPREATAH